MPSFRSIKLSYSSPPPALPPCEEPTTPPPSPPPPRPPCSPCQHKNHSPPPPPPPTATAPPPPPPPPHNASLPASPPPPPSPQPGSIAPPPKTPPRASNYPSPSPSIPLPFYPAAIAPTPYFPPSSGPQQSISPLAPPHSNHHPLEVGVSLGGLFFLSFLALGLNHIFGKKMFVPGSGSSGPSGGGELTSNAAKAVHVSEAVPAQPQPRGNTGLPGSDPPSNDPSATEPRNVGQEEPHEDNQSEKKKKKVKADTVVQSLRESTKLLEDLLRASNINPHRLPPQTTPSQHDRGETSSTPYPAVYNGDEFEEKEEVENADDDGGDQNPDKAAAESNAKEQEAGEDNQPEEVDQVDKPKSKEQDDDAHRASRQSLSVGKKLAPKKTRVGKAGPTSLANINAMKKIADLEDRKLDSDPIKESDREETVNPEDSKIEEDCAAVESVHEETVGDERVVEVTKQEEEAGESEELAVEKLDESKTDEHDAIVNIDDALKTTRKAEKSAGKKKPPGGRGPSSSARHINDIKKLQPDSAQQYFDQMIQAEGDGEQAEDNQDELKDDTAVNDDDDDMDTSIIDGKTPGKGKRRGRPEKQTAMSILKDFNKTHQKLKPEKEEKADDTNLQDEESQGNGEDHVDEGVPGDEEDYSWMQELGDLDAMGLVANLGLFNTWSKTVENLVERNRKLVYKLQKKINEPENSNRSRRTRVEQDEGKMSGALKGKVNMAVDEEDPQAAGEDDLDECGEVGAESSVPDAEAEEESQYLPAESEQGMRPVEKNIRAGNHGQQARAMGGALKGNAGRKSRSRAEQATSGKSKGKVKNAVDYKDISGFTNPEVAGEGEEEAVMNRLDEDEAVSPILDAGEESGEVEELETMNEEVERMSTEKGEEEEYQQGMWSAGEMPPMNFESLGKGSGAAKNIKAGKRAQGVYEEGAMKLVEEKSRLLKGRNIPVAKNIKSDQQAERPAISSALNVLESGVFGEQGLVTDDANKSFLKEYKNTDDDLRSIIPKEGNGAQSVSGALVQMGVGDEDISEFTNPDETDCSESWLVKGKDAAEEMPNESEVKRLVDEKSPVSSDARKRAAVAQIEQAPAMSSALDAVGMFDSQVILPEKGSDRQKKAVGGKHSLRQQAKGKGLSGARVKPAEHDIIADEVGGAKAGHRRTISQKRAPEIEEQTGEKLQPDPVPLDFEATEADAAKDFEATEVDDAEDFEATEGDAEATEGDAGATEVDAAADDEQSATPI